MATTTTTSFPAPTNGHSASDASKAWTSASQAYLGFMQAFTTQATSQLVRDTALLAPYTPTSRVLDNGSGSGSLTFSVLAVEPSTPILATDVSQGMLDLVAAKAPENVSVRVADAMDLRGALGEEDGGDGVYSHVLSSFMVQFTPEPWTPVREMRRVLKTGGVFGLASWGSIDFADVIEVVAKRLDPTLPFRLGLNPLWPTDAEGVKKWLVAEGFVDVEVQMLRMAIPQSVEVIVDYCFDGGNPVAQAFLDTWREVGKVDLLRAEVLKAAREQHVQFTTSAVLAVARKA